MPLVQIAPASPDGRSLIAVIPDSEDTLASLIEAGKQFIRQNCAYEAHVLVDGVVAWKNY